MTDPFETAETRPLGVEVGVVTVAELEGVEGRLLVLVTYVGVRGGEGREGKGGREVWRTGRKV